MFDGSVVRRLVHADQWRARFYLVNSRGDALDRFIIEEIEVGYAPPRAPRRRASGNGNLVYVLQGTPDPLRLFGGFSLLVVSFLQHLDDALQAISATAVRSRLFDAQGSA